MARDAIGLAHIWRETHLLRPEIFISDILQARLTQAGLRVPKHFKMNDVMDDRAMLEAVAHLKRRSLMKNDLTLEGYINVP